MSIYSNEKMQDKMQEDGTDQFISVDGTAGKSFYQGKDG